MYSNRDTSFLGRSLTVFVLSLVSFVNIPVFSSCLVNEGLRGKHKAMLLGRTAEF